MQFYSGDISALYTNLSITYCIDAVIELAGEHWEEIDVFGISLTDLHLLLDMVFTKAYFTFDGRLYWQWEGLFMGCGPSAGVAILGVYRMERNSVYTDVHYLYSFICLFYSRYMDDMSSVGKKKEDAEYACRIISEQDERGRIKWEIDYPTPGRFTPFLDTEVRIQEDGTLDSRYYRKPQDKGIIVHAKSHHPANTKQEVMRNFYKTAIEVSSGPEELQHSLDIVDSLAEKNGYPPRQVSSDTRRRARGNTSASYKAPLKLPYISEAICNKIRNYIKQKKLDVRPIFTPGKTLGQQFCRSRPFDRRKCTLGNPALCTICPAIANGTCATRQVVYRVDCLLCQNGKSFYNGETDRPCHERFAEHTRAANNPDSYSDNAIAKHFQREHREHVAETRDKKKRKTGRVLNFTIIDRQSETVRRKISEAISICKDKPTLNERDELTDVLKFVLH